MILFLQSVEEGEFNLGVSEIIIHPLFQSRLNHPPSYNIALLKLDQRLQFHSSRLSPVCWNNDDTSVDDTPVYSSWGVTQFGSSAIPSVANLPIMSSLTECQVRSSSVSQCPCLAPRLSWIWRILWLVNSCVQVQEMVEKNRAGWANENIWNIQQKSRRLGGCDFSKYCRSCSPSSSPSCIVHRVVYHVVHVVYEDMFC